MGLIDDLIQTRKNNKQTKANIKQIAIDKAKKIYARENPGKQMTPSRLKSDYEGMFAPKSTKKYEKDKALEARLIERKLRMD